MRKCQNCRDADLELTSRWERLRDWLFRTLFADDVADLRQSKYTQGFSDGWLSGFRVARTEERTIEEVESKTKELLEDVRRMTDAA